MTVFWAVEWVLLGVAAVNLEWAIWKDDGT